MNVVIIGSASLDINNINKWVNYWEEKNYSILIYPKHIDPRNFYEIYPNIHKSFFEKIKETDILFVCNEEKNGIDGYVGAETFAEIAFGVAEKLLYIYNKKIKIILAKKPSNESHGIDEINHWLKLSWIDEIFQ